MQSVSKELQRIVVLCAIIIGGVGYLGYSLYFQNPKVTHAPVNINTEASFTTEATTTETAASTATDTDSTTATEQEVDTAGWQTYTNSDYGFKISYPPEFEFGGADASTKTLFSLTNSSIGAHYEFWVQELGGKTLEQVFEEKLGLTDMTYFEWVESKGAEVSTDTLGANQWLFLNGTVTVNVQSSYLVAIPGHDAYLIAELGVPAQTELPTVRAVLSTLIFTK